MEKKLTPWEGPVGKCIDGESTDDSYAGCDGQYNDDEIVCNGDIWTRTGGYSWRDFFCQAHRDVIDAEEAAV